MNLMRARKTVKAALILSIAFLIFGSPSAALEIKRKTLADGLTLLHVKRDNLPVVMVTLLLKASPLDEPADRAGLAYLTATLLTEGTKSRTSSEISEETEFIGASLDAGTNQDYTIVRLSVLKKDINKGFELFSDVLLNPKFSNEEIERKRELIKGSLRQREEEPSYVADRAFKRELYGSHPYGRVVEGSGETLDKINRKEIVNFHKDYYAPNNAILAVVGDVSGEELDGLIKKFFRGWEKAGVPESGHGFEAMKGSRLVRIDKDLTQANILFGGIGIKRDNPDFYAVSVMNYILGGGGFSSRLMRRIRDEMGLAYDVHSFFTSNKEPGYFQVGVQTKNASANTVIEEITAQIKSMKAEGVASGELEDAKAFLTGSFPGKIDTMRKIADFISTVEFYGLGTDYMDRYPAYINSVTPGDIKRVAAKYLDLENCVLVVVADQKKADVKDR
ncbi:MAG: pitrilysin family protein [Thermodesulfovibrionales bacterium]|nr:pitrilysin family protein [Thermodesulfovibrionales bacterium]